MFKYNNIEFQWLGHDGFKIKDMEKDLVIYTDPYKILNQGDIQKDAQIILISHNHFDHLSIDDISKISNENTKIIAPQECETKLKETKCNDIKIVKPGETINVLDTKIEIVPAYNTNKNFHPKEDNKVGYILTLQNTRIYHSGDTDEISEMKEFKPDIALVPVSGTYVMDPHEAAHAINELLKPKLFAIPMHYNSIVGTSKDAEKFKNLVKICDVKIL